LNEAGDLTCCACGVNHSLVRHLAEVFPGYWTPLRWLSRLEPLTDADYRQESIEALLDAIDRVPVALQIRLGDE
jgi:hypothetical protein